MHALFGGKLLELRVEYFLTVPSSYTLALMTRIVSKHDTFRRDCQKKGADAISLKPSFSAQGVIFSGKGVSATRASTLSPNLGGSSLAALFSDNKM